jgi:acyl-CoA thioester hydrolase
VARIKIELPERFGFSADIPVRIADINRGGHVSWNSMFGILEEANVAFWKSLDAWEMDGEKVSRITVDAGINYKRQAFHGQTLRVEITAADLTEKGFDLIYRVTDAEEGTEIARAKVGMLCFDYDKQKIISIPEKLRARLTGISNR